MPNYIMFCFQYTNNVLYMQYNNPISEVDKCSFAFMNDDTDLYN